MVSKKSGKRTGSKRKSSVRQPGAVRKPVKKSVAKPTKKTVAAAKPAKQSKLDVVDRLALENCENKLKKETEHAQQGLEVAKKAADVIKKTDKALTECRKDKDALKKQVENLKTNLKSAAKKSADRKNKERGNNYDLEDSLFAQGVFDYNDPVAKEMDRRKAEEFSRKANQLQKEKAVEEAGWVADFNFGKKRSAKKHSAKKHSAKKHSKRHSKKRSTKKHSKKHSKKRSAKKHSAKKHSKKHSAKKHSAKKRSVRRH